MIAVMIGFVIGLALFASGTLLGYAVGYHDGSGVKTEKESEEAGERGQV